MKSNGELYFLGLAEYAVPGGIVGAIYKRVAAPPICDGTRATELHSRWLIAEAIL